MLGAVRGPQTKASGNHVTFVAISNLSVVPVDADGSFCVYNQTSVHIVVDLQGLFSDRAPSSSSRSRLGG